MCILIYTDFYVIAAQKIIHRKHCLGEVTDACMDKYARSIELLDDVIGVCTSKRSFRPTIIFGYTIWLQIYFFQYVYIAL